VLQIQKNKKPCPLLGEIKLIEEGGVIMHIEKVKTDEGVDLTFPIVS